MESPSLLGKILACTHTWWTLARVQSARRLDTCLVVAFGLINREATPTFCGAPFICPSASALFRGQTEYIDVWLNTWIFLSFFFFFIENLTRFRKLFAKNIFYNFFFFFDLFLIIDPLKLFKQFCETSFSQMNSLLRVKITLYFSYVFIFNRTLRKFYILFRKSFFESRDP